MEKRCESEALAGKHLMRAHALFIVGVAIAASYLLAHVVDSPQWIAPIWKAAGIVLLGLYASSQGARLAAAGLFASAIGDIVLALEPPLWIAGMAAFGVAHVLYALAFLGVLRSAGFTKRNVILAAAGFIGSIGLFVWLRPGMDAYLVPGAGYHAIITAMMMLALLSRAHIAARAGAVLFVLSDFVIALYLYKAYGPFGPLNWLLYASAQALIAWGLTRPETAKTDRRA